MTTHPRQHLAILGLLVAMLLPSPGSATTSATTSRTAATHHMTPRSTAPRSTKTPAITPKTKAPAKPAAVTDTTGAVVPAAPTPPSGLPGTASADTAGYTIPGGQEGAVFKSLTVEGEDRVHFEFERPELVPDLDPAQAPGLDPGNPADVLMRSGPDLTGPFAALSAHERSTWLARPWLAHFASGPVARFRPELTDVTRWRLLIANARGETVATIEDKGHPPTEIAWDGRAKDGTTVIPDLTYSYVFEAHDRAGNKRNFVGEGFVVSAYRIAGSQGPELVFSARELAWPEASGAATATQHPAPPVLLEAAWWMNQATRPDRPVQVVVTARGYEQADAIAGNVVRMLAPQLVGDPGRIQPRAVVQADAPEAGTVRIAYAGTK